MRTFHAYQPAYLWCVPGVLRKFRNRGRPIPARCRFCNFAGVKVWLPPSFGVWWGLEFPPTPSRLGLTPRLTGKDSAHEFGSGFQAAALPDFRPSLPQRPQAGQQPRECQVLSGLPVDQPARFLRPLRATAMYKPHKPADQRQPSSGKPSSSSATALWWYISGAKNSRLPRGSTPSPWWWGGCQGPPALP
ncbi:hypothetical protein D3C78_565580 [compost metagenome]